jgi:uncharacterized protein (DUF1697 family)
MMEKYISILRGINVGGRRKVSMVLLKSIYEDLGFKEVLTYIQSGNVIFASYKVSSHEIEQMIEKKIDEILHLDVPVIIRQLPEMKNILANNPFLKMKGIDIDKLHVTFLNDIPGKDALFNIKQFDYSPDKFIIKDKEVFIYCPGGYGKTKLSNNFFENKLKVKATTRNWKTVNKLAELASG